MAKSSNPPSNAEPSIEEKIFADQRFLDLRTYFNFDFSILHNPPEDLSSTESSILTYKKYEKSYERNRSELSKLFFGPEERKTPISRLDVHSRFLMQLSEQNFQFKFLEKHLRKFEAVANGCLEKNHADAQSLASIAIPALIQPVHRWAKVLTLDERNNFLLQLESIIDKFNKTFPLATKLSGAAEFKSYIMFAYVLVSAVLEVGISSHIFVYHLVYFRKQSISSWASIHPRERLLFSVISLHIFLSFYKDDEIFTTKYGFSHNTFTDLHSLMNDAYDACNSLGLITAGQVFMWVVERIESEALGYNDLVIGRRALKGLTPSERRSVVELVKRFSSYRIPVTVERTERFLAQFVTTERIRAVLKLLSHLKYYPLWQLGEAMEDLLKIESEKYGKIVVSPLGDRTGSTAIINYLLSHSKLNNLIFADDLKHALKLTKPGDRIYFVDDCALSGTQSIHIMQELMGERELKPHHTKHCDALSDSQKRNVYKRTLVFAYCLACDTAIQRMTEHLALISEGKISFSVLCQIPEPFNSKAFNSASFVPWESNVERDSLKVFCSEIGYSLLEPIALKKDWSHERRVESSLGYSDFQRLLVFPYSVPKTTLPILWTEGHSSFNWTPLFPVIE